MASIDERVVAMSFENTAFEAKVSQTMITLGKLNSTLATIGSVNGLENIEKAGNKVTLQGPMSALDKLRARLGGAGQGADEGFASIEKASSKVSFLNPMTAIDKLRARLGTIGVGADEGFASIEKSSSKVTLAPVGQAIDGVIAKFSGLQVAAAAAFGAIVAGVAIKAKDTAKGLSLGPITGGLEEYATNLNSIQTILANTKASGANLQDVNGALKELNQYADQTIYNFSQMAKNIGTFTAAGVDLKTATASIKGIANLAALSGSNSQQASTAMYQLSQAISSGRVSLQDWNSVVNAGMGGTVFQRALTQTAEGMGTLSKGSVELKGKMKNVTIEGQSFRESITAKPGEKSWLTSEVLTNTLKQFTGDLSAAEIKAMGFNDQQAKAIMSTAKTAKAAATEVKTLKGVMDVVNESIGSGWAATFELIFGNFTEAKKTFTGLSNAIQKIVGSSADSRNKILADWKELGGRSVLIEGIKNVFKALASVLKPIREAFREIFPKKTGEDLYNLTVRFRDFAEALKIGPETAENLKRTFAGFFAILSIGKTIVGGIIGVIFDLFGVVGKGSGGFLNLTGSIGDFLVSLDNAISKGKGLEGVFNGISAALRAPLELLTAITASIGDLFKGDSAKAGENFSESMTKMKDSLGPLGKVLDVVVEAWEKFLGLVQNVAETLAPVYEGVKKIFSKVGDAIITGLEGINYDKVMTFIQTTFLGGLALGVKKLLGGIGIDFTGGALDSFKAVTKTLTSTLTTIQKNVNARTMLLIAGAVLALALATIIFSQIDPKRLAQAMGAISVGIGQLVGAMALLTKVGGHSSFLTLPLIASSMLILAGAMVVLGLAVTIFSKMSWEELAKGLIGVAGGIAALSVATKLMGPSITLVAPGLLILAGAMTLLAVAMKMFGSLDWEEIAKGMLGIAGSLTALSYGIKSMGPSLLLLGPGLIAMSLGLILLSGAVGSFGALSLETMAKGIIGLSAAIVIIGAAIARMPPSLVLQAYGLAVLAIALTGIAGAIGLMGSLGIDTIAKGLITMAGALAIFAVAMTYMTGTVAGSAALLGAAIAIAVLTPALAALGQLEWGTILKGLAAMAGALFVLAGVGAIVAGPLIAIGVALAFVGLGVITVGAGMYLLAKAFQVFGAEGTKGIGIMIAAITAFIALLPKMVIDFISGLVQILAGLATLAPKIADSLVKILTTFINALIKLVPKGAQLIGAVLVAMIGIINKYSAPMISAGLRLLNNFLIGLGQAIPRIYPAIARIVVNILNGLANAMPRIISAGVRVIVKFLAGIGSQAYKLANAGFNLIIRFINGIARALRENDDQLITAFGNLGDAIIDALVKALSRGARAVINKVGDIGKGAIKKAKGVLKVWSPSRVFMEIGNNVIQGFALGLRDSRGLANKSIAGVANDVIKTTTDVLASVPNILDGVTDVDPVITPVLDLSSVEKSAKQLTDLTNVTPITAATSYGQAAVISEQQTASQTVQDAQAAQPPAPPTLKFEQNNYSPESLSDVEIYRRTNNQLAMVKNAVGIAT